MTLVGLPPALGAFLAGVVLASSEYKFELENNIDPYRGLLLGLILWAVQPWLLKVSQEQNQIHRLGPALG